MFKRYVIKEDVMKRVIVFVLLLLSTLCYADNGADRKTVEKLLIVMNAEAVMDSMYSQIDQLFVGMAEQFGIKEAEQAIFDRYMSKVASAMKEEMSWEKMKGPIIDIYMKHYTQKELEDMLSFYSSQSGKSIIVKMPQVAQESMLITQMFMKDYMPKIKNLSEELHAELKEERCKAKEAHITKSSNRPCGARTAASPPPLN